MAEIKAFGALRFTSKAGKIEDLVCPPYDIISEEERKAYLQNNQNNVIRLELPREGEDVYAQAGAVLKGWEEDGILKQDDEPALYVYEIGFQDKDRPMAIKGLICRVKLEEFSKGVVLPHEETLSKAKTDRFNLMKATGCNFSQIYSLYMDEERATDSRINAATAGAADVDFVDAEGLRQRLWIIRDAETIAAVCKDFEDRKLYIADGHHRYETALNYRNHRIEEGLDKAGDASSYVMMMLVSMENEGLLVLPTHRIVRDLTSFDLDLVLNSCNAYFDLEEIESGLAEEKLAALYAKEKTAFALYTKEKTVLLILRDMDIMQKLLDGCSEAYKGLDVNVLHTLVLERLFGIDKENMANQKNLTYTKLASEAIEAVDSGKADCAILLNPTRVTEIRDVALAGEKMPQKSTYFYPKLITGLVMNEF